MNLRIFYSSNFSRLDAMKSRRATNRAEHAGEAHKLSQQGAGRVGGSAQSKGLLLLCSTYYYQKGAEEPNTARYLDLLIEVPNPAFLCQLYIVLNGDNLNSNQNMTYIGGFLILNG